VTLALRISHAFAARRIVDVTAEHESTLKAPPLFRRGLELVFEGFAGALPVHTPIILPDRRKRGNHQKFVA
jgi:hypothetical protein